MPEHSRSIPIQRVFNNIQCIIVLLLLLLLPACMVRFIIGFQWLQFDDNLKWEFSETTTITSTTVNTTNTTITITTTNKYTDNVTMTFLTPLLPPYIQTVQAVRAAIVSTWWFHVCNSCINTWIYITILPYFMQPFKILITALYAAF